MVKKLLSCNVGNLVSIAGLGRSPGGGHGNPFQYYSLKCQKQAYKNNNQTFLVAACQTPLSRALTLSLPQEGT